jgi:hypothetical protein
MTFQHTAAHAASRAGCAARGWPSCTTLVAVLVFAWLPAGRVVRAANVAPALGAAETASSLAGDASVPFAGDVGSLAAAPTDADIFAPPPLDDEACTQVLRQCCCCPGWDHYAIFDVLFLQRNNQAGDQPLAINSVTGVPVLSVQDVQPSIGTGVRLFYGRLLTEHFGWEVGYTGIYGMFGDATATGNEDITFPDPIGGAVLPADSVRAGWLSTLNITEANLFCYDCCEECGPCCRRSCHCSSWLVGFVWAGLNEQSTLTALCCDDTESTMYGTRTSTNYFGPQIGRWGRREWCRWAVEGWWKAAVCGTSAYQAQDPIVSSIAGEVRPGGSATDSGVGFLGGLNGTLIYRLTDVWGIRAGYNCYWLTNAALAPTQYDFGNFADSGTGINDNGGLFLHGANLGVEARW